MPLFLLGNWRWLIPTAIATFLGIGLGFSHIQLTNLRAADARALALATEAARAQEQRNATIAQEVEKAHAERSQAIDDAFDANRELARTRGLRVRGVKCVSQASSHPGDTSGGTAEIRLPDEINEFLLTFARDADQAASYARECHDWAIKIGE